MLVFNRMEIGNNLLRFRKKVGLTQAELAESAGIADRTYADIERGGVNMRVETLLSICDALQITPNDVLVRQELDLDPLQDTLFDRLKRCPDSERGAALSLLSLFLDARSK